MKMKLQDLPLGPNLKVWDLRDQGYTLDSIAQINGELVTTLTSQDSSTRARVRHKLSTNETRITTSTLRNA